MKKNLIVLLICLMFGLISTKGQELYNESKGFGAEFQFFGLIGSTRLSPIIDYKIRKLTFFVGYDFIKYQGWKSWTNGIKAGYKIFPHKNKKPLKFYYQSFISFKWDNETYIRRMYLYNVGLGLDYNLINRISVGFELSIGHGLEECEFKKGGVFDPISAFSIKYRL